LSRVCKVPELNAAYCVHELTETFAEWETEILANGLKEYSGTALHHMCRDVFLYGLQFGTKESNYELYDGIRGLAEVPVSENMVKDKEMLDTFCVRVIENV
jgi:hypothetical protein